MLEMVADNLHRPYPNKIVHHLDSDHEARPPRELTPLFFGCYDWHSAVHSHWAAQHLLAHAAGALRARVEGLLELSFSAERVQGELAYLAGRPSFEMPYGMAWLLQLCLDFPRPVLEPLEQLAAERFLSWVQLLPHPIRTGEHSQSAFAMGLAHDYGRQRHPALAQAIERQARAFYGNDRNAPLAYEPSAYDFLSPTLAEADLMRRVLSADELSIWLRGFYPEGLAYRPVTPVSRSDGKLVHFDGLNLSRAWMLKGLDRELARAHGEAGMTWLEKATYMGTHWLPSFSVYWLLK